MREFLLDRFFRFIVTGFVLIWFLFKLVNKKELIPVKSNKTTFMEWYKTHTKPFDIAVKILVGIIVFLFVFCYEIPFALDIPDIITNNYKYVCGTVLSKEYHSSRNKSRVIIVKDDSTKDEISITADYTFADEGDYIEIKYLKHCRHGIVVKHVEK